MTYEDTLAEIVLHDQRFIVMTAENRASIRRLPDLLEDRFIDTGINEQLLVGAAAGLALRGRYPVVHALAAFLTMRAFEFIRTDVGLADLPVKLVGGAPGFLSTANGPTHQAIEDIALMHAIPTMHLFCPADVQDLSIGLPHVLKSPHPCYIRLNELPAAFDHRADFSPGQAEVVREGSDVAILTYGTLFQQAHAAAQRLQAEGYSVQLVNMRMLRPLDEEAILLAAERTRLVVTVEDHLITGGLYSMVGELLIRRGKTASVLPMALKRWYEPLLLADLLEREGFSGEQMALKIKLAMELRR